MLNLIVATTRDFGIGYKNRLPWNYPDELSRFRKITTFNPNSVQNTLIMGRITAESLPKALPNRTNILLTTRSDYQKDGFVVQGDLLSAFEMTIRTNPLSEIYVIGGAQIYREALKYPNLIKRIYLTTINKDYECDVKIPELAEYLESFGHLVDVETHVDYTYNVYEVKREQSVQSEQNYLDILLKLCRAPFRQTRNALTKSLFSSHLTFDLQEGFPLLTTKRVFWKGIVNELLFFLGGCTDNNWLKERGVHIWDANTTKEFIDNCGLLYEEDDLGPMYGAQFRHYGAEYIGKDVDYTGQGKDQFSEVIDLLVNDPFSRRILMTSYNYDQVKLGVLYPCHSIVLQFYVDEQLVDGETVRFVSLQMYQRSGDYFLGVCYNIASNALLLHIVVNILNHRSGIKYDVGKLHMIFGDYHLYENHIRQAITQMARMPRAFPKLNIKNNIESIDPKYFLGLELSNFEILDYNPYPGIKAEMVA